MRFATKPIRVGQEPETAYQSVIFPLYQTSTFAWDNLDGSPELEYTRVQNPTRRALEEVISALENGTHCTTFSSGMAAVMAALSILKNGDHMIMASDIYGGTHRLAETYFPGIGVETTYYDAQKPASIDALVKPNTKLIIFESPTNPTLRVMDIAATVAAAKKHGLVTIFDNTFASPALQNPLDLGVDMVLHSTTKYIGGHSDVVGGCVVTKQAKFGDMLFEWNKNVGSNPSPFDCWLTLRGLKTLDLRMQRHCSNAQKVAEFLASHPRVEVVHYPGLTTHPDHELAKRQMRGFGGMMSFVVKGSVAETHAIAKRMKLFLLAESLGGVESLVGYPTLMSHGGLTEDERLARGIPPTMLRLSVGIEDPDDQIEDLQQALDL